MPYKYPEAHKEWRKKYYQNNTEREKTLMKEWRENNKEHIKEKDKIYRQTPSGRKTSRIKSWKQRGIIVEDYEELYDYYIMSWNCEYCWRPLIEGMYGANRRCLDHDHDTGEPRGVICSSCNTRDVYAICEVLTETL